MFRTVCSLVPQLLLHTAKNKLNLARIVAIYAPWLVKLDDDNAENRVMRLALVEYLVSNYDKLVPAS